MAGKRQQNAAPLECDMALPVARSGRKIPRGLVIDLIWNFPPSKQKNRNFGKDLIFSDLKKICYQ